MSALPPPEPPVGEKCESCDGLLGTLKRGFGVGDKKETLGERLNRRNGTRTPSDLRTPHKWKEVGAAYGAGFLAKGLSLLGAEADARFGTQANAPYARIRTGVNLLGGIVAGAMAGARGHKMSEVAFDATLGYGVVAATELVDPIEEMVLGKQLTYGLDTIPTSNRYNLSGVDTVVPPPKSGRSFT